MVPDTEHANARSLRQASSSASASQAVAAGCATAATTSRRAATRRRSLAPATTSLACRSMPPPPRPRAVGAHAFIWGDPVVSRQGQTVGGSLISAWTNTVSALEWLTKIGA